MDREIQVGDYVSVDGHQYDIVDIENNIIYFSEDHSSTIHELIFNGNEWEIDDGLDHHIEFMESVSIYSMPEEMMLTIISNLNVADAINLCLTDPAFVSLCKDWRKVLMFKYPQIDWRNTSNEDAMAIDKQLEKGLNDSAIIWASEHGHYEVVRFLASLPGVDPTGEYNRAIALASKNDHLDIVRFLSALPGVEISSINNYALRMASRYGHSDIVKLILNW